MRRERERESARFLPSAAVAHGKHHLHHEVRVVRTHALARGRTVLTCPLEKRAIGSICSLCALCGAIAGCVSDPTRPSARWLAQTDARVAQRVAPAEPAASLLTRDPRSPAPVIDGELPLSRAVQLALAHNLALIASSETLAVAQANLAQAGLWTNPVIGQNSGFLFPISPVQGRGAWDLSISQTVNTFLTRGPKVAAATAQREQAALDHAGAAFALAMQVERKYADLVHLERSRLVARRLASTYEQGLRAARSRAQVGLVPTPEVNRARLAELDAQRQSRRLDSLVRATRSELNFLMGVDPTSSWTLPTDVIDAMRMIADPPSDETLTTFALGYRLDLERAECDAQLAAAQLSLAQRGRIPNLNLGFDRNVDSTGAVSIGPFFSVTLPIFDSGTVAVELAEDQVRLADRLYLAKSAQVRDDARAAAANVRLALDDARFFRTQSVPQQEENVRLAQEAFAQGVSDLDSLLNVLRDYSAALQSAEDAELALDQARVDLEQAAGLRLDRMDETTRRLAEERVREATDRITPAPGSPALRQVVPIEDPHTETSP